MCGIIGYTGKSEARGIILDGLATLEYRGYDSAGAALGGDEIVLYKCVGRVRKLASVFPQSTATCGIGHTRWATHGEPCIRNAHPHLSPNGKFALVHNGIIENCRELKSILTADGKEFVSDTDSEILAHLIEKNYEDTGDMLRAIERTVSQVEGAATFLVLKLGDNKLYCHRRGAALVASLSKDGAFVASDMLALAAYSKTAYVIADDETAVLSPDRIEFYANGVPIQKENVRISCSAPELCECNMRQEIAQIPAALEATYLSFRANRSDECINRLRKADKIVIFGCGTAYHAALYGKEVLEEKLQKPTQAYIASECESARFLNENTFAIFISQSGETADTLSAVDMCRNAGATTLAITNVNGSTLTFKTDYSILLEAGAEIAVAATKSYNCQLLALWLVASTAAGEQLDSKKIRELCIAATNLIGAAEFTDEAARKKLFFVGKGIDRIAALEGALKFKEITYKMTDAYPAGELKHGTIALIDENSAVIVIATDPTDTPRLCATINELKARHSTVCAVSAVGELGTDVTIPLPTADKFFLPILSVIPLQTLALTVSCGLGINPDKPRNLAKCVTVI